MGSTKAEDMSTAHLLRKTIRQERYEPIAIDAREMLVDHQRMPPLKCVPQFHPVHVVRRACSPPRDAVDFDPDVRIEETEITLAEHGIRPGKVLTSSAGVIIKEFLKIGSAWSQAPLWKLVEACKAGGTVLLVEGSSLDLTRPWRFYSHTSK